jgi:phosphoglycerate dehydrogenase-like enzyme
MRLLVLREGVHGTDAAEYATALRDRLPDHEVVHARTPSEERREVTDAHVVTGVEMDEPLLEAAGSLRLFAGVYAGHGHLPLDTFEAHGVGVTNAAGVHAPNAREYVVGALLSHVRSFHASYRRQERGEWRSPGVGELAGSTVTVVGLGNIGGAVTEALDAFDVTTVGVRNSPEAGGPADEVVGPDRLHDALARSDAVVLACPLTDATRGLVGEAEFTTMPADCVLVNVARGPVVDTEALVAALQHDDIGGATLDVTDPEPLPSDHPLWSFGNVQITPHNAGRTPAYYDRLADLVAGNVDRAATEGWDADLENRVVPVETR